MAMTERRGYVLSTHVHTRQTHVRAPIIHSPSQLSAALPPHLYLILQKHDLAYLAAVPGGSKREPASLTFRGVATKGKALSMTNTQNSVTPTGCLQAW